MLQCIYEGAFSEQVNKKRKEKPMPRMSKKLKHEWSLFLNHRGRRCYNSLCRRCVHSCKQSFRATVVECPRYFSKRAVGRDEFCA